MFDSRSFIYTCCNVQDCSPRESILIIFLPTFCRDYMKIIFVDMFSLAIGLKMYISNNKNWDNAKYVWMLNLHNYTARAFCLFYMYFYKNLLNNKVWRLDSLSTRLLYYKMMMENIIVFYQSPVKFHYLLLISKNCIELYSVLTVSFSTKANSFIPTSTGEKISDLRKNKN